MNRINFSSLAFSLFFLAYLLFSGCGESQTLEKESYDSTSQLFQSYDLTDSVFSEGIEGPCFHNGYLYLVNFKKRGNIARVSPEGKVEMFAELSEGSIGNGIRVNSKGFLMIADYKNHNILRLDVKTQQLQVFAHEDKMNQPNDLAITKNDIIFATDPDWKKSTGKLWKIDQNGRKFLLESGMGTTNGIELSPNQDKLYVNESIQKTIWVYDVDTLANLSNKKLFMKFNEDGLDGMKCDSQGNLYVTRFGKGTIAVISPKKERLREILLKGKNPTNLTFGGSDGKTVYVTVQDRRRVEYFYNDIEGREYY